MRRPKSDPTLAHETDVDPCVQPLLQRTAFVTERIEQRPGWVRTMAFWSAGAFRDDFEYDCRR